MKGDTAKIRRMLEDEGFFWMTEECHGFTRTCWAFGDNSLMCFDEEDEDGHTYLTVSGISPEDAVRMGKAVMA